jgi:hypothetical protein
MISDLKPLGDGSNKDSGKIRRYVSERLTSWQEVINVGKKVKSKK